MSFDENKVTFDFDGAKVISRLLAGEYLDYSKMFLTDLKSRVTANRADLLGALERATLIGERKTPVTLEMDATSMKISSRTELGSMYEDIDIECDGDDLTIYFNISYIVEALKSMTSERVALDFSSQMRPCIIREDGNEDCKYLVVPLRPESAARYSPSASESASTSTPAAAAA
jgi:DNA polymerase-3 subunit beta